MTVISIHCGDEWLFMTASCHKISTSHNGTNKGFTSTWHHGLGDFRLLGVRKVKRIWTAAARKQTNLLTTVVILLRSS
ncbi:hypothetical protein [Solibacillus sp. FSL H8-0538]|uniref:hypothetical protein n=1 Tax=Solibacillus sp. FSL H8-0538 TaxID=2921400 RepID=UPI0030F51032